MKQLIYELDRCLFWCEERLRKGNEYFHGKRKPRERLEHLRNGLRRWQYSHAPSLPFCQSHSHESEKPKQRKWISFYTSRQEAPGNWIAEKQTFLAHASLILGVSLTNAMCYPPVFLLCWLVLGQFHAIQSFWKRETHLRRCSPTSD